MSEVQEEVDWSEEIQNRINKQKENYANKQKELEERTKKLEEELKEAREWREKYLKEKEEKEEKTVPISTKSEPAPVSALPSPTEVAEPAPKLKRKVALKMDAYAELARGQSRPNTAEPEKPTIAPKKRNSYFS